ncbi:BrxA/BrxB family bacilliredoxin [Kitasatospora aureofaciens]|uniref:BrxA/BrxB family bacilliredoxin n=1 Tax=Kitasatospora aureofaciens TaxID=1894 RepID=UPI0037C4F7D6
MTAEGSTPRNCRPASCGEQGVDDRAIPRSSNFEPSRPPIEPRHVQHGRRAAFAVRAASSSSSASRSSRSSRSRWQDQRPYSEVDYAMEQARTGTTLVVFNFVDGCSAEIARPGVCLALENGSKRPDRLFSVEQDLEATARMRAQFAGIPPSQPSIAIFKDGELVYFVPRHRIEGRDAQSLAVDLQAVLDEFGK